MEARRKKWVEPTLKEVAAFFRLSYQTVRGWRAEGMPSIPRGGYYLPDVVKWRFGRLEKAQKARASGATDDGGLGRKKLELETARRLLAFQKEVGELVSRTAAKAKFTELLHRLRTRLEAVPQEVGASFPAQIRGELIADCQAKIRLICREIENWSLESQDP